MYPNGADDIDMLFARLESAVPPQELRARVLAGAQGRSRRRQLIGYSLLAASIILGALLAFTIGQQLRLSGALALVDFFADAELLSDARAEVALALIELIPWHLAALVVASLAMVVVAVRLAISPSVRFASRAVGR